MKKALKKIFQWIAFLSGMRSPLPPPPPPQSLKKLPHVFMFCCLYIDISCLKSMVIVLVLRVMTVFSLLFFASCCNYGLFFYIGALSYLFCRSVNAKPFGQ